MVFGGEELSPPEYGKVFIGIKPKNGNYLSNFMKNNIESKLKVYSVAGIVPKVIDLSTYLLKLIQMLIITQIKSQTPMV